MWKGRYAFSNVCAMGAHVCVQVYVHMCLGLSGSQRATSGAVFKSTMLLFETWSLTGLEFTKSAWLAGQEAPGIHPALSPRGWDYKHVSSHPALNIYT